MKSTNYLTLIFLFFIFGCASVEKESVVESGLDLEQYAASDDLMENFDSSIATEDLESAQYFLAKLFQRDSISEDFQHATVQLKELKRKLDAVN